MLLQTHVAREVVLVVTVIYKEIVEAGAVLMVLSAGSRNNGTSN